MKFEDKKRNGVAGLFCSAALLGLAGCGGGGGGDAAAASPTSATTGAGGASGASGAVAASAAPTSTPAETTDTATTTAPDTSVAGAGSASGIAAPESPFSPAPGADSVAAISAGTTSTTTATTDTPSVPAPGPGVVSVATAVGVADSPAPAPSPAAVVETPAAAVVATAPAPVTVAVATPAPAPTPSATSSPMLADCEMFPSNAIFNTAIDDVSRFPVHPESSNWINRVGGDVPFRTDWGVNDNPALASTYWGMPINVVDGSAGTTSWPNVLFDFSSSGQSMESGWPYKSDCAVSDGNGFNIRQDCTSVPANQNRFPFPHASKVLNENGQCGGPNSCGDHHVLVVEAGVCRLWESYYAHNLNGQWYALTTAAWNLRSNDLRPVDWASGDAAGLPITPLLAKAAEASTGEIKHALRVTFRDSNIAASYVWPARHAAGGDDPGAMPFGALLRLKASFVIPDNWTPQAKALARAAKRYGMYVSDNGENFHVQGEPNSAWDGRTFFEMQNIKMSDMEFVDLKSIKSHPRFSNDSMAASW